MTNAKSILIIDDDEALRAALEAKFSSKGYTVTVCSDGAEGLEKLKVNLFSVIMTDLHMPNLDGFWIMEQKLETKNADTPLYVITNLGSDTYCEKAIGLGAKKCFVKSIVTLRDVVETIDAEIA